MPSGATFPAKIARPEPCRIIGVRDTAHVELFALALDRPRRNVGVGETLIADGLPVPALYVLVEGALRIEKAGVAITTVSEPGACIGEMSLLLDVPGNRRRCRERAVRGRGHR